MKNLIKKLANNPKTNMAWWILVLTAIVLVIFVPQIGVYVAIGVVGIGIILFFNIDSKRGK